MGILSKRQNLPEGEVTSSIYRELGAYAGQWHWSRALFGVTRGV